MSNMHILLLKDGLTAREKQQMLKVSWIICNIQKKNPEVRDVVEIQRPFLCEKAGEYLHGMLVGKKGEQLWDF